MTAADRIKQFLEKRHTLKPVFPEIVQSVWVEGEPCDLTVQDLQELIRQATQAPIWVSVNDRLPDKQDLYVVRVIGIGNHAVREMTYNTTGQYGFWSLGATVIPAHHITHWATLPKHAG